MHGVSASLPPSTTPSSAERWWRDEPVEATGGRHTSPPRLAAWRSTVEGLAAAPYLAVAVMRPLLPHVWPLGVCLSSAPRPGVLHADAPERALPGQPDWQRREARLTLRSADVDDLEVCSGQGPYTRQPRADSHAAWLAEKPYRLVLGSGFIGIYQHMGRIRALDRLGLVPREIVGYSSGAIAGSMVCCLSLEAAERAMMELRVADFLDPSFTSAWNEGGACAGVRLEAKIARTLAPGGLERIEDLKPRFEVAVFDRRQGKTTLLDSGPLARSVRQSAALPLLFRLGDHIDGGWIDHHGRLAMLPGQRALQSRLRAGDGGRLAAAIGREGAIFSISDDPEHATLCVQPDVVVKETNFVYLVDHDKAALKRIVDESERLTLAWLACPRGTGT